MKVVKAKVGGAWYYQVPKEDMDTKKWESLPRDGWVLFRMQPGKYSEKDVPALMKARDYDSRWNVLLLGKTVGGRNYFSYYLRDEEGEE